jgi:hypothetical protein
MFEDWAAIIGGILDTVGIPGFLANLDDFYQESDAEGAAWRSFVLTWWEAFGDREVKVSELWQQIKDDTALPIDGDTDQAQKIRLGKLLSDKRDRTFSLEIQGESIHLRIERGGQRQRAYLWKLAQTTPGVSPHEPPEGGKNVGQVSECELNSTLHTCAHAHTHARVNGEPEQTHTHSLDSHPADCIHEWVERPDPNRPGWFRKACDRCGELNGYRPAEART